MEDYSKGKKNYPKILEIDPTSNCMYQCNCCINSNLINRNGLIDRKVLCNVISEFSEMGGEGIIFIGGGEPLMYPDFGKLLEYTYSKKIKIGITTNGFLIDRYLDEIASLASWVRVSMDAATKEIYDNVRPCNFPKAYERVIENIRTLSKVKVGTLGYSFLLIENEEFTNVKEIYDAAILARDCGCDYFEVKPMVDNNHFLYKYSQSFMKELEIQIKKTSKINTNNFKVIFANSMGQYLKKVLIQPKEYTSCLCAYLRNVITSYGVFPCPYKRGHKEFNMGSISNGYRSFVENDMRNQVLEKLNPSRDCVFYCIRDEINQFLDALSNGKSELEKICFNESEDVFV